jgi:thiol-disulfide isomerase/thioredoxin
MKKIIFAALFLLSTPLFALNESQYQLVLFFSSKCPHCLKFAPVVKSYGLKNHLPIEAISLNHKPLREFPTPTFATQEMIDLAYQGKTVVYPALFLADTKLKRLYPISYGALSQYELDERMEKLSQTLKTQRRV